MTAVVLTPKISTRSTIENTSFPSLARRSTTTVTSQNIVLTAGIRAVNLYAIDAPCRIAIGSGTQTANASNGIHIAANHNVTYTTPIDGSTNIAVIRDIASAIDGTIEITELRS
jgi:hypothetical protein